VFSRSRKTEHSEAGEEKEYEREIKNFGFKENANSAIENNQTPLSASRRGVNRCPYVRNNERPMTRQFHSLNQHAVPVAPRPSTSRAKAGNEPARTTTDPTAK